MIRSQLFIAAALLAGVAIGYFTAGTPVPSAREESATVAKKAISDSGWGGGRHGGDRGPPLGGPGGR